MLPEVNASSITIGTGFEMAFTFAVIGRAIIGNKSLKLIHRLTPPIPSGREYLEQPSG
jgi:hypothetical protein